MLLAIEQGNTNTMFAIHDGESWIAQWRAATESTRTADEYVVWLSQLLSMQGLGFRAIDAVHHLQRRAAVDLQPAQPRRRYFNVEPLVIGENAKLGVDVRIDKPSEAGADRLVNAVGAHMVYPGPLIVIDSGTATTFDIVAADGAFEGGIIAPGHQSVHAGPARGGGQAAAHRHPASRPQPHRRHRHRQRPCNRACFGAISP
jgi:type III pantothenate kinase